MPVLKITVIGTGSDGNCYLVESGDSRLMLDAGLSLSTIIKGCDFSLQNIEAVLITHEHQDHCKAAEKLNKHGLKFFMSAGTAKALGLHGRNIHIVQDGCLAWLGKWSIMPLKSIHDAAEPLNFLITDGEESLLYVSDTAFIEQQFKGLNRVIIECNWMDDNLHLCQYRDRLMTTHMSLEQVIRFFATTDRSRLKEVVLVHPSSSNMDLSIAVEELMKIGISEKIIRRAK